MGNLINNIVEAYGGLDRWNQFTKLRVTLISSGRLFDLRGFPQDPTPREMSIYLHEQRESLQSFGGPRH
ncbi:hypothetical protein [Dyadobacter frigoris]|uniref:Uncharacterized protein n=2 Tax=Dyadobacter frigoris TaxID=2576211 RepID=A0A4U6D1D5_9BACT|nr:hypothetical protein [Dyadobacter frigoris]TKT87604.1 hypothetical protein FDK13_28870 [Dyadobacter frigoris]GLU52665.1 hypothetical protein Dfri01_21260 [Dyadobacter frigoris]